MSISLTGLRAAFSISVTGVALIMMGCSDATSSSPTRITSAVARREAYEASKPILEKGREEIDQLEKRASIAEGTEKEDLQQQKEILQAQHARAEEALQELNGAELDDWQIHEQNIRIALQDLDSSLKNIR